jgi:predicted nucleic acid-binding protein
MVAVSNTSPISNLSITGRLDLLRSQFGQILIPESCSNGTGADAEPGGKGLDRRRSPERLAWVSSSWKLAACHCLVV